MLEIAAIVAAECALLVAVAILREPKLLILAVVVGLPVEYFGTQTLSTLGESGVAGAIRALLNPGKLAMLATICVVVVRERHTPARLIPNSSAVLPILLLLTLTILGIAWSDSLKPSNAALILPMYVAFVFTAPTLIEDRRDVERIVGTFLVVCIGLSLIAIAQRLFGIFNWRAVLIQSDGYSYRSNATFADPNHLARYMALCISLAVGLILATGPRRTTVYLAAPLLAVTALGILVTASRSGWAMVIFCTAIVVFAAPIARYTKVKLATAAGTALGLLIVLLLVQGGENAQRVASLASPVTALGQRDFLIRVGWQEFIDNPLIGVGTGNYQHALITTYRSLIPDWAEVTLSHTSMVSILAEWGILGLAMFLFIMARLAVVAVSCYRRSSTRYIRLITAWLGAGLLGIVLHSQSEGRLFDEPYLYLLIAILVAIETGPKFAMRPATEPAGKDRTPAIAETAATLERPAVAPGPAVARVAAEDGEA